MTNILRPQFLKNIIGNENIKKIIEISIKASLNRGTPYPSCLLTGCSGCGKTTFAFSIATELGVKIYDCQGENLKSIKNLLPFFGRINQTGGILFIDEIHRTSNAVQTLLYSAIEDFYLDSGKGLPRLNLRPFTLIGVTTTQGMLLQPLLNRFVQQHTVYLYSNDEMMQLIEQSSKRLEMTITREAISNLSQRSRGVPRVANNYLMWIRDYADSKTVTSSIINEAMNLIGVGSDGTGVQDRIYLDTLRKLGNPTGLSTLVASIDFSSETIQRVIEPFLLQQGKIRKTSKGRILV